jgi:hypothetical protein
MEYLSFYQLPDVDLVARREAAVKAHGRRQYHGLFQVANATVHYADRGELDPVRLYVRLVARYSVISSFQ